VASRRAMFAVCAVMWSGTVALPTAADPPTISDGPVTIRPVEYGGWKNNLRIANADAELIVTLDVGPRVMSYKLTGGANVLKEFAPQLGKSGEPDWQIRGGHRLWTAPEDLTRTYAPDNGPVKYTVIPGSPASVPLTVRFTQPPDAFGIQKEIDISLAARGGEVTLLHRLINIGKEAADLAPWALTVVAPGGMEIIPLPPKARHPGSAKNAKSPLDFAPSLALTLWPYTDFKDPRYGWGSKYLTLKQANGAGPTKIGLAHKQHWVGYLNGGYLFVKRFGYQNGKIYPDNGSNFETFTSGDMLEMETLGPMVALPPGGAAEHAEIWELFGKVPDCPNEQAIDQFVLPLATKK
jgi:hypothetical protein